MNSRSQKGILEFLLGLIMLCIPCPGWFIFLSFFLFLFFFPFFNALKLNCLISDIRHLPIMKGDRHKYSRSTLPLLFLDYCHFHSNLVWSWCLLYVIIFMQAALYQTDFRPVPLEEYIKVGYNIYNRGMEIVRTIAKAADLGGKDPDHIIKLCNEVCIFYHLF